MKRLALLIAFLALSVKVHAAVGMDYVEFYGNKGATENTTVAVTSTTAALITPTAYFSEITLSSASVRYFYRIDGTTTSVTTLGFPVIAGTERTIQVIKGNPLAIQLEFGASQTLRVQRIELK